MKRGKRKQWIWKSPRLQEQSHPLGIPTGAFKGQLRTKRHIGVQYIACSDNWRKDGRDTTLCCDLLNYASTHASTHTHTGYSPPLSLRPFSALLWVSILFCWPVCGGVDRGEHTISRRPNTENWITPGLTSSEQRLAYLHPVLSKGPFRADGDPCLAPGFAAPLPRLPGNMTTYTRPCQTHDWHVPAHLRQHSHPPRQITPKPRQTTISANPICALVVLHMLHTLIQLLQVIRDFLTALMSHKLNQGHKTSSV